MDAAAHKLMGTVTREREGKPLTVEAMCSCGWSSGEWQGKDLAQAAVREHAKAAAPVPDPAS